MVRLLKKLTREGGRDTFEVVKQLIVLGPELLVEILVESLHITLQLLDVTAHLLELLIVNVIEFGLDRFKVLLVLLVRILNEVVQGGELGVGVPDYPSDLELLGELAENGLNSKQILLVLQSYQCQLLIQRVLNVFLDLLAGHHVGVDLEGDVVDLLAELVVELVGRVAVPPTHPLQIGRLLGKVCRQVLLHALDKLLQLFLFLGQVFVSLGDGSRELSSACVGGVAHLSHLLVLRYR